MDSTEPSRVPGGLDRSPLPAPTAPRKGSPSRFPLLLLVLAAALLFRLVTGVTGRGDGRGGGLVRWMDAAQAPALARASGKPILYDFTAEWCGPCHVLDRQGWGDAKIAKLVNDSFTPARVVDRMQEEGRNPTVVDELERRYGVGAFPTLVVATPNGQPIAVAQGFAGKQKLLDFLESSLGKTPSGAPQGTRP